MNYNFDAEIGGITLFFTASPDVFSPKGADAGTMAMLDAAKPFLVPGAKVLDLGCGYGLAGIYAAKMCGAENVVMSDISAEALRLSAVNAELNGLNPFPVIVESDCFKNISLAGFDLILCNPPYHTDFSVPKEMIEKGFNRLKIGGRLFMVTKRLSWYKNKITAVFGGVKVTETNGYFIFSAELRQSSRARI